MIWASETCVRHKASSPHTSMCISSHRVSYFLLKGSDQWPHPLPQCTVLSSVLCLYALCVRPSVLCQYLVFVFEWISPSGIRVAQTAVEREVSLLWNPAWVCQPHSSLLSASLPVTGAEWTPVHLCVCVPVRARRPHTMETCIFLFLLLFLLFPRLDRRAKTFSLFSGNDLYRGKHNVSVTLMYLSSDFWHYSF